MHFQLQVTFTTLDAKDNVPTWFQNNFLTLQLLLHQKPK